MAILSIKTEHNFIVYLCYIKLIISHIIINYNKLTAIRCIEDAIISHRKQMVTGEVYPDNLTSHETKLDWPNNIFLETIPPVNTLCYLYTNGKSFTGFYPQGISSGAINDSDGLNALN
ncbi:hypothetical protein [Providencia rettgeri]|uniref:hypothetical protein n=1 Tax=Providencia TaxID=586 RepID=UPI002048CCC8|nr:hypothetical protein [Providencia rettgeri]ELR5220966.1 hypothetical protein [Providencia rettgeri]MDX7321288.1 hypothetical protein [Providencia rettgeri]UPS64755.1 hypothetical protein M0M83_09660 [Providencia rettgeri]